MGDRRHPAPPIAAAHTNSRHLLQSEASSYRFGQLNSSGAGAPNYLYCAPQSSYSSNRMRDAPLDDAAASAASATCHAMSPSSASNSYATSTNANTSNSALASASSHKTLTATVYYQQQPQQHQTQQQQQQQYQQQQTTQLPVQLQLQHPQLQAGGDGKQSVYAPPTVQLRKQSRFNARKKFQFAILVIRAVIRIRRLRFTAEPLHVEEAIRDPYRVKVLRKVIDGCAFRVYGHWVKKGEGQNRAALFENTPRTELHALYINNLSR